jgi:hypothetical protein
MRQLLFFLTFFFALTVVCGQTTFKYGAELGLAFSQFPKNNSYTISDRNDKVTETTSPLYSPLVGLTTNLIVKNYLQFSIGLQYQNTGQRYHYHRDGNDLYYNVTYRHDVWENQTFHKLCLPISAGLTIKVWKMQPSIFIGYRFNYFISGKYYNKSIFDHDIDSLSFSREYEFNPLDKDEIEWSVKPFHGQFFYGFATAIGQHFKISATVARGQRIYYSESAISCLPFGFTNNDYIVTVAYFLPTLKKRTDKCVTVK